MLNKVQIPASAAAEEGLSTKSRSAAGKNNRDRLRDTARDKNSVWQRECVHVPLPPQAHSMSLMVPARRLHVTA